MQTSTYYTILSQCFQSGRRAIIVQLNSKGEIGDFLDVNQFIPSRSAYECVAYSAALIKYAGEPGHGPSGTALQASNLAQFWYGKEEGSNLASNTNGMSLDAMYNMLDGMGLQYGKLNMFSVLNGIKTCLELGEPVLLCGHEDSMYDLDLGDRVPYSWTPTGNHAIVVSGVASDGNLLVHDCANIAPTGVRTGPRRYDASKLQIVSATAIKPTWEVQIVIDINSPGVANYFTQTAPGWWQCKNGKLLHGEILAFYTKVGGYGLCGVSDLGLPVSNEIALDAKGNTKQHFERGVVFFDPGHVFDNPPGAGRVYKAHLYSGPGVDPAIALLQSELAKATQAPQQFAALEQIATEAASALGKHLV